MLSARTIFEENFDNDEAFRLFCSIAASGEANWRRHLDTDLTANPQRLRRQSFCHPVAWGHAEWWRASYGAASAMGEVDVRRTTLEDV
jgi:hypothetical protein